MSMKAKHSQCSSPGSPISFIREFCRTGGTGLSCSTGRKKKTCMQLNNVGMKDIDTNHLNRKVKEPKMMTRLWNVVSVIGLLTCLVLALWHTKVEFWTR